MKYKKLTESQIKISIDRLTRFKPVQEKYLRVFKDIIISNLIEPKLKKSELDEMSSEKIRDIATEIFNSSLEEKIFDNRINNCIKKYENTVFYNDEDENILLENSINYKSAIKLLQEPMSNNLKWLKELEKCEISEKIREKYEMLYPLSIVILVEGITEEILLPLFAKKIGYSFDKYGIKIIAAGGKNQVVKMYYSMCEKLKLPIFILLDKDAVEQVDAINVKLRKIDKVHLVGAGEFEDLLPKELIVRTINSHLQNFASITIDDINKPEPMVRILEEIFKDKGIHEFKKAEFAHLVSEQIRTNDDISDEVKLIIDEIKNTSIVNKSLI